MSLIAINVCIVSMAFDTAAIPLSNSLCPAPDNDSWDESIAYRLVSLAERKLKYGYAHAHCTLVQLCVRATELSQVKQIVKDIWSRERTTLVANKSTVELAGIHPGPVFSTKEDGTEICLPNISMTRTPELVALHEELVKVLKPFHVSVQSVDVGKSTFHRKFEPEGECTVRWMNEFISDKSGDNYGPHITLGSSPKKSIDKLTFFQKTLVPWRECRVVVSHMGSYGSCFELLE